MMAQQTTPPSPVPEDGFQHLVPVNVMPPLRRNLLFAGCELLSLRKGETPFSAGDSDDRLYYLIEGRIAFEDEQGERKVVEGGASLPLNPQHPRTATATAHSRATVLHCSRRWFDALLLPPLLFPATEQQVDSDRPGDWLQRLLDGDLFRRLPAASVQQLFSQCEPLVCGRGQTVIEQGGENDSLYIVQSGRCEAVLADINGRVIERLGVFQPGDSFGEVSLLAGVPAAMRVTMLADGALLRLQRPAFDELVRQPLVATVDADSARERLDNGAVWLDVREPGEADAEPVAGAECCVFSNILEGEATLADRPYVVICDSGARSAVAAFVLALRGFQVSWLAGGLAALSGREPAPETATAVERRDPLLLSLRNDLTRLLQHVDNAMHLKGEAEIARREAEHAARRRLEEEQGRLQDQARQVRSMLEQTQQLQRRLVAEKERLYAGLKRREQAVERRISKLNAYIERRVAEERERLEQQYRARETEIDRLQFVQQRAESRVEAEASSSEPEQSREALEAEFNAVGRQLRVAGNEQTRVQAATLTQELVDEMGQALDEAGKEKLAGYQATQSDLNRRREQLEARASELSSAVQDSYFDRQATAAVRDALLQGAEPDGEDDTDETLRAATERYNEAEEAYQQALNAEQENRDALADTEQAESEFMQELNAEIEAWMEEQASSRPSPKQQELISRYEETMQRMQKEAAEAEEQERTRDDLLLSDINAALEQVAEKRGKNTGS